MNDDLGKHARPIFRLLRDPRGNLSRDLAIGLRDGAVRGDHANIACPTLLTVGDQDPVTPLSWQRQIAAGIAGSRIRVVPGTAHMTMLEAPAVFNTVVLEFLATLEL